MIKIDKKIPVPSGNHGAIYPYRQMEVGDSFLYPKGVVSNSARVGARRMGQRTGRKFIVRMVSQRRLRCWRIE